MTTHLIPINPFIEAIFSPENLDEDCQRIASLMRPIQNAIDQYLFDEQCSEAATLFLQLIDSLCYHFVIDEHWCWFDDSYDPGYTADCIWENLKECLGWLPDEIVIQLKEGIVRLSETESFQQYGYPSISKWLDDMNDLPEV